MSHEIRLLATLSNAFGPSGNEEKIREILKKELEEYADEVRIDKLGNILFFHQGKERSPKVMLAAHMDEVAFIVTFIEENGFLRFQALGGITSNIMPGQMVLLQVGNGQYVKGIIGTKPPHIMTAEEQKKVAPIEDLFIDIGAESLEEVEGKDVEIGTRGVFDIEFAELGGGYLRGKAFDDRAGCTV
ncbi:MAG: M42 family peptidase, partial [Candidatus Bathyarchaeota archaeon]|nr:M42 family peptidase [Candidatus Bathyarchaeota archaeon]